MSFCFISVSFSQTGTIEKGTYISGNKGQKIKLNLLDNNKYELVFYSGEYKVKGDSLIFVNKDRLESNFDLSFSVDKKAKKIKIKFLDPLYYSFYIGTQKGKETVQYQKVSDIKTKVDPEWQKTDLEFDIEKTDYLYLVYEDYNGQSNVFKYALPKDVSEIAINYEAALLSDLKITGLFDEKTNELKISEQSGRDPLVFVNEKNVKPEKTSRVKPLESEKVLNWTYPGKEPLITEDFGAGGVADSTATANYGDVVTVDSAYTKQYDFKLKIENNLKNALAATKQAKNKYLVIAVDNKNASAKENFNAFIKDQEVQTSYSMYDAYNPSYDIFNYYLAGADDKKWLKNNKVNTDPVVLVLSANGDILAIAKSDLTSKKYQLNYYGDFCQKLKRADVFVSFDKTFKNKKTADTDLIAAFNKAALLEPYYDYDSDDVNDENNTEFVIVKKALDQKEVFQNWKKLIEAHQKDTKPNMYLVETILKEIGNQGFTKQLFNEDRILNDTDFLSIDYLLKHSSNIEENRTAFNNTKEEVHNVGNVVSEISSALQRNIYVSQNGLSGDVNKDKIISIYKTIIAGGKGNFEAYRSYFEYLSQVEDKDGSNTSFLKEFNTYFESDLASGKESPIEKLDAVFSALDASSTYSYDGWNAFKEYHSNLCNSAAWSVVLKPSNSGFIKSAIIWSEYSLIVTKNNPYYLDTLAQLYYKDGQKDKAIQTQTLAVKYLSADVEEETAGEIKETLNKMQNGTY